MEKKKLRSDKIAKKSSCKNIVIGEKEKYYVPSHSGEKTALCRFQSVQSGQTLSGKRKWMRSVKVKLEKNSKRIFNWRQKPIFYMLVNNAFKEIPSKW